MTIFFRGNYLIGAVIACSIFYIGAAIWDLIEMRNTTGKISGDLIFALILDAGFPLITISLLILYLILKRNISSN